MSLLSAEGMKVEMWETKLGAHLASVALSVATAPRKLHENKAQSLLFQLAERIALLHYLSNTVCLILLQGFSSNE